MSHIVLNGDNVEVLKKYPDNYFDAVVTDPPYGLGKEPNAEDVMKGWIEKGYHEVGGKGFMGKEWDAFIPQPIFWKEVFRVLKHGGHVLAFYGTRTYDWGVMAMRFAGFEVRDTIYWHYGSGFPKSHNISKAIDKMPKANNRLVEFSELLKEKRNQLNLSISEADDLICGGSTMYNFLEGRNINGVLKIYPPNKDFYEKIKSQYKIEGWDDIIENNLDIIGLEKGNFGFQADGKRWNEERELKEATTKEAKQWEGWGSALKPASEPIVMARKPLEKGLSIAENVLKYGTGAINIDGCRVGLSNGDDKRLGGNGTWKTDKAAENVYEGGYEGKDISSSTLGRFPANLIMTHHPECECNGLKKVKPSNGSGKASEKGGGFSKGMFGDGTSDNIGGGFTDADGNEEVENWDCHEDCPIRILDEQSGITKSGDIKPHEEKGTGTIYGNGKGLFSNRNIRDVNFKGDSGGASRFFYCAKASKSERNKGLDKERWFYNLELVLDNSSFTEQNLFIWEQGEQNQNMDLIGEVQQKKDISEGIVLLVEDKECYTTFFGKENEVIFPKAIKFITSTGISQIIELKTLNFYQHLNISDCIADVIEMNKANGLSLAENVGIKNLLKQIFIKDKMGFLLGVKIVAKKMPQLISVKDIWQKSNIHSTVKPIKLMQYLVRLVTPPNGVVLDPFCGSGTTGIACKLEGLQFVGIEQDAEYTKIAEARIENYQEEPLEPLELIKEDSKGNTITQKSLF